MKNLLRLMFVSFLFIIPFSEVFCQSTLIQIGETCPDVRLSLVNFKTDQAMIADFKGKLLILDFWATWCAPCVSMIPVTDSLQKEFENKIQILPVTGQNALTVTTFLNSLKSYKNILMPSVINDKSLAALFPHTVIPHYVWLDENSNVIAITGAEQLTAETIRNFLNKKGAVLPIKEDKFKMIRAEEPMFVTGSDLIKNNETIFEKINNSDLLYHSVITRYIDGFGCEQAADSGKITCKNTSVGDLYRMAASHYNLAYLSSNSTVWEASNEQIKRMSDSSARAHSKTKGAILDWMNEYTYCYELKFPKELQDKKYDLMLSDLNNYFGAVYNIVGSMERKKTKCLALVMLSGNKLPASSEEKNFYTFDQYHLQLKNASVQQLISLLSINLDRFPPLIDETNHASKFDIDLKCNLSDLNSVNSALMAYGLQLVEKVKEREMIVIKDKP